MKILGLGASCRRWGNSEILVQAVLAGARDEGAETRFLRLPELHLGPCTGCMACVFKERDCVQPDRHGELLDALRWAQGYVFGSPAYVLGATAEVKNLHDRLIRAGATREFAGRPAVAVASAGVPGWTPFTLAELVSLPLFLGMPVVDQFVGFAQGPGEILDDPTAMDRARTAGAALGRGERSYRGEAGGCPCCHLDLVVYQGPGQAHCPLCNLTGRWDPQAQSLVPLPGAQPRWSPAEIREHFVDRVLSSGPRFMGRRREIAGRVRAFRDEIGA